MTERLAGYSAHAAEGPFGSSLVSCYLLISTTRTSLRDRRLRLAGRVCGPVPVGGAGAVAATEASGEERKQLWA